MYGTYIHTYVRTYNNAYNTHKCTSDSTAKAVTEQPSTCGTGRGKPRHLSSILRLLYMLCLFASDMLVEFDWIPKHRMAGWE